MKNLVKHTLAKFGYRIAHLPPRALPLIEDVETGGQNFPFWIANEHALSWWVRDGADDSAESFFLQHVCRPDSVVFDVGAHHGMQTMLMAKLAAQGEVHAFEANPQNAMVLFANVALNRLTHCSANSTAVGAESGMTEISGEMLGDHGLERWTVPMISIDDYCRDHQIDRVDVIKIDVEGYEGHVLKGASATLKSRPHINLELHQTDIVRFGSTIEQIFQALPCGDDYEITVMDRSTSWQTTTPFNRDKLSTSDVLNVFFTNREKLV
ncbi:FkbM family methyltransferase, partial [Gammaproteobacteria bacterium]|nr:FkbM family methyltransferase [Gammaproteobacteria bacterium]